MTNEEIFCTLRDEIVSMKIKPGEYLSENTICDRFEISRTPVRGILQRLSQDGLVEIYPKKGSRVTRLDYNIIGQMIFMRVNIESRVLEEFIKMGRLPDIERARYALTAIEKCAENVRVNNGESFDGSEYVLKDLAMHRIWFDCTNKSYLWEKMIWSDPNYARFCALDVINQKNVENAQEDHRTIMKLIDDRNSEGVYPVLEKHLYGGMHRLGARIDTEFKDYFYPINL